MSYLQKSPSRPKLDYLLRWLLLDAITIFLAFAIVFSVRSLTSALDYVAGLSFIFVAAIVILTVYYMMGVYHRIWSQSSGLSAGILITGIALAVIPLGIANLFIAPRPVPLSVWLVGSIMALVGTVATRYRSRLIQGIRWRMLVLFKNEFPSDAIRVLIIGAGTSGQVMALHLRNNTSETHYTVIGFLDDNPAKQNMVVEDCPVLGTSDQVVEVAEQHNIELIIFAIHNISGPRFREILTQCEQSGARIKVMPDMLANIRPNAPHTLLREVQAKDLIGRHPISRHEGLDLSPIMNKVVLVTGAAGSIGAELSRQLATYDPIKLIVLDNNESALHDLMVELSTTHPEVEVIPALVDVTLRENLAEVFDRHYPQIIFHAAAYKHVSMMERHPNEALRVNIHGTLQVAELAIHYDVERFVLVSTDKAVQPTSVMGASKRLCELILHSLAQQRHHDTLFTSVRFGNVLGSRGSVVPIFTRQIDTGGPVTVTHKDMRRYFMSISEAVNLVIHAACITEGDDIFVLRMGEEVRIVDIAERMIRMRGLRPNVDIEIKFIGILPGEKLQEVLFEDEENPSDTIHPHIIRLNSWVTRTNPEMFLNQVRNLGLHGLSETSNTVFEFMAILQNQALNQTASMN